MQVYDQKAFTMATGTRVYFYYLGNAWQGKVNENRYWPLHQYFPKKTNLSIYLQAKSDKLAKKFNQHLGEALDLQTLSGKLNELLPWSIESMAAYFAK
jgi:IS30 family transposase